MKKLAFMLGMIVLLTGLMYSGIIFFAWMKKPIIPEYPFVYKMDGSVICLTQGKNNIGSTIRVMDFSGRYISGCAVEIFNNSGSNYVKTDNSGFASLALSESDIKGIKLDGYFVYGNFNSRGVYIGKGVSIIIMTDKFKPDSFGRTVQ